MSINLLCKFDTLCWSDILHRRTLAHSDLDQWNLLLIWIISTAVTLVTASSSTSSSWRHWLWWRSVSLCFKTSISWHNRSCNFLFINKSTHDWLLVYNIIISLLELNSFFAEDSLIERLFLLEIFVVEEDEFAIFVLINTFQNLSLNFN